VSSYLNFLNRALLAFALLVGAVIPVFADDIGSINQVDKELKQKVSEFLLLYNKKIDIDNQYPFDFEEYERDALSAFEKKGGDTSDDGALIKFKLDMVAQMMAHLEAAEPEHVKIIQRNIGTLEERERRAELKIITDEIDRKSAIRSEAKVAKQRLAESSPTYYIDVFNELEVAVIRHYNKRINYDSRVGIEHFGYRKEARNGAEERYSAQELKTFYRNLTRHLQRLNDRVEAMSPAEIASSRAQMLRQITLKSMVLRHQKLAEDLTRLGEFLDGWERDTSDLVSDASEQCTRTNVDYDCHSECEKQVRDPIFGTYKTDYDYSCLRSCSSAEEDKQAEFDEEEKGCFSERNEAREELEAVNRRYRPKNEEYETKRKEIKALESEIELLNKN